MTEQEIRTLRDKIGTDPILTDEEIEYIWLAMDKEHARVPDSEISEIGGIQHTCPSCWGFIGYMHEHCENCGQKIDWSDSK